ncbi:MAG: P-aminobenzoate N-oxygenase AurF, partial [Myxococcota bacterium]
DSRSSMSQTPRKSSSPYRDAFKTVGEAVEAELFGERVFTYEMRGPFAQTVTFADTDRWRDRVRRMLLRTFGVLSAQNAFVGCQYFLVRGLRTLLGKIVQHRLASFVRTFDDPSQAPVPTQISEFHFQDESYHFNSSTILSHDVLKTLPTPTRGERFVMNRTIEGAQRDLRPYCVVGDGLNWHGPQTFDIVYRVLRSRLFAMDHREALEMMRHVYTEESDGLVQAQATHATAVASYRQYLDGIDYLTPANRDVRHASGLDLGGVLKQNRRALGRFRPRTQA